MLKRELWSKFTRYGRQMQRHSCEPCRISFAFAGKRSLGSNFWCSQSFINTGFDYEAPIPCSTYHESARLAWTTSFIFASPVFATSMASCFQYSGLKSSSESIPR